MPRPVISVENLSKAYRIGLKEEMPDTLVGAMKNVATAPWRNFHRLRRLNTATATAARNTPAVSSPLAASRSPLTTNPGHVEAATTPDETDTLWALRDVSFEVNEGDVVGIIGRNGAGKSTLLKILSRITEPTSGRAVIRGRVSSLLEVGTGFHPELTGRENIYMNGTILGMRKKEIDRKFDEIVDFSGVEKFLDTPTKRYSSGMQVRLAFAVAAHLEPEILIVDEVLAVGDAAFQQRCIGKMQQVSQSGRTVVFVSHNLSAVNSLCNSCIYLLEGSVETIGETDSTIGEYLQGPYERDFGRVQFEAHESIFIESVEISDSDNKLCELFRPGDALNLTFRLRNISDVDKLAVGANVEDSTGLRIFTLSNVFDVQWVERIVTSCQEISCRVEDLRLVEGTYFITLGADHPSRSERFSKNLRFEVVYPNENIHVKRPKRVHGVTDVPASWSWS